MKKLLLSGLATAVFAISGSALAANFVAGQDYIVVPNTCTGGSARKN